MSSSPPPAVPIAPASTTPESPPNLKQIYTEAVKGIQSGCRRVHHLTRVDTEIRCQQALHMLCCSPCSQPFSAYPAAHGSSADCGHRCHEPDTRERFTIVSLIQRMLEWLEEQRYGLAVTSRVRDILVAEELRAKVVEERELQARIDANPGWKPRPTAGIPRDGPSTVRILDGYVTLYTDAYQEAYIAIHPSLVAAFPNANLNKDFLSILHLVCCLAGDECSHHHNCIYWHSRDKAESVQRYMVMQQDMLAWLIENDGDQMVIDRLKVAIEWFSGCESFQ